MSINIDIKKWEQQFKKQVRNSEKLAAKITRAAGIQIGDNIIVATTVGNPDFWQSPAPPGYTGGTLRGNWQANVNSIPSGTLDTQQTSNKGVANSAIVSGTIGFSIKDRIFIANNLPYAQAINEGHSVQPGVGTKWVNKEANKFDSIVQKIAKKQAKL